MKLIRHLGFTTLVVAFVALANASYAAIIPVTGWVAHNQSSPVTLITNDTTNSPTMTPADQALTVMGTFPSVNLANDGDFIKLSLTLQMSNRTGNTGVNALNTQLRMGLFKGPDGAVTSLDVPNVGAFVTYANNVVAQEVNRKIREQGNASSVNPLSNTADISDPSTQDVDGDSIQGANPGPVYFELVFTRNAAKLDLMAQISGTDSVTTRPFLINFSKTGYDPVNFGFTYNRAAFFFGNNTDAPAATLSNVNVETNVVPEPASLFLAIAAIAGSIMNTSRRSKKNAAN
jgi:hypothetical protein